MAELLRAFRELRASWPGQSPQDHKRQTADFEMVYHALQKIAWQHGKLRRHVDEFDAAGELAILWRQQGPRGTRLGDPQSEEQLRRFMYRCLHNKTVDLLRRKSAQLPGDMRFGIDENFAVGGDDPEAWAMSFDEVRQMEAAARELFDHVVPQTAATLRADRRASFLHDVHKLQQIVEAGESVDALAWREVEAGRPPVDRAALRNLSQSRYTVDRETQRRLAERGIDWRPEAVDKLDPCTDGGRCCLDLEGLIAVLFRIQAKLRRDALDQRFQRCRGDLLHWLHRQFAARRMTESHKTRLVDAIHRTLRLKPMEAP